MVGRGGAEQARAGQAADAPGAGRGLVCALCEHVQATCQECDVCGRPFGGAVEGEVAVEAVPGLEPTWQALDPGGLAGDVDAEPFEALELTAFAPAGAVALDAMPDLEETAAEAVVVGLDPTPDLEGHLAAPVADGSPPALLGAACRYCRAEALPGEVFCGRCGVRLPLPLRQAAAPGGPEAPLLCSCGVPVRGSRCPACGARHA